MFYYPAALKRHTGCFSTIWLVATKGIRVPRRDFLRVNIRSTCKDVMNYVLEQVPPPHPGLPRPRFSLYLSSQLQYGIVVVFHRQCAILLEELHFILGQLLKQRVPQKIDMDDCGRQAPVFPDALTLLEETEGASDPLFGVMHIPHAVPSPSTLMQMGEEYLSEASSETSELTIPTSTTPEPERGITASPDTITLRETGPVAIPTAEFEGVDLVDHPPDTLDFLLAETDHFPEEDVEMLGEKVTPAEQDREIEREAREEELEKERTKEATGSTIDLQPTPHPTEDLVLLSQEDPSLVEKPGPSTEELTPESGPALPSPPPETTKRETPSLELEDEPALVGKRKRRKRQLIFFDPETQIPQEVLQTQIGDTQFETRPPPLPAPSSPRGLQAANLLNNPCASLPEEVELLWRQAATITPISGSDLQVGERGPESTDSEKEREQERVDTAEKEEERTELSSKEVPRDLAESEMFDTSGMRTLSLEASDQRDVSRELSPMLTSEREGSPVSRPVSALQDIPEVVDELLEEIARESPGLVQELAEHEEPPVLFQSLLPPEVNRRTVSSTFLKLLEAVSDGKVRVEQTQPYGDVLIFPGPNYNELQMTL